MSIDSLAALVKDAEQNCEQFTCEKHGHAWESAGGRQCPRGCTYSQTYYVCRRCGEDDYGDRGGPAHADCFGNGGERCCDGSNESDNAENMEEQA